MFSSTSFSTYRNIVFTTPTNPKIIYNPNQELTITPVIMTKKNPLLATEYRRRFYNGELSVGGTYTRNNSTKKQIVSFKFFSIIFILYLVVMANND